MKKIMTACLDRDCNANEEAYGYYEVSEADYGDEWDGDVIGYIKNADWYDSDIDKIISANELTIYNQPESAYVVAREGHISSMFWAVEA